MIKVADEIWVATALLHRELPDREDFSIQEIIARALRENLGGGYRPGLQIHASNHCVAIKPPNPARHRMLHETGRGRRRLFRDGDPYHPHRRGGKTHPNRADLPYQYTYLVDWYEQEFHNGRKEWSEVKPSGTPGRELLAFGGAIKPEDLRKMAQVIGEECETVDLNEW